ncbi:MAG: hypothetical protein ABID09_02670 [Candidatus Omnitrophota bacterium]
MRRLVLSIIIVLSVIFAVLFKINMKGDFTAEKDFYNIKRSYSQMPRNPDATLVGNQAHIEKDLIQFIKKFPQTIAAKHAHLMLATLFLEKEKFAEAIALASYITKKYKEDATISSYAQFIKAQSYEIKKDWEKALDEYDILMYEYTQTSVGAKAPLYVARYYAQNDMPAEAQEAYKKAALFYDELEKKNRDSLLGLLYSNLLVATYVYLENFEEAGKVVEGAIVNYAQPAALAGLVDQVYDIFVRKLNRPEKAMEIYSGLLQKTQESPLARHIIRRITDLRKREEKSNDDRLKTDGR